MKLALFFFALTVVNTTCAYTAWSRDAIATALCCAVCAGITGATTVWAPLVFAMADDIRRIVKAMERLSPAKRRWRPTSEGLGD